VCLHLIVVGFIKAISLKFAQCPSNKLHSSFSILQVDFLTATFDSIPNVLVYERYLGTRYQPLIGLDYESPHETPPQQ